jgi:RNA polymerase sigma-70 factor (ECF subfamily)
MENRGDGAVLEPDVLQRKAEFARLLSENQSRLYGYIHSLIPDLTHADDLFQQTALVLWDKFDAFDRGRSFFSWACGVARYEAANYSRRLARQRKFFGHDLNLLLIAAHEELSDVEVTDRREALTRCVGKLREDDRVLLTECYTDAAGVPGVAARRNRSPHSVYNSLQRIRLQLFHCITRALAQ